MTKRSKFIITTAWILFSRSYDAYCTNQLTPDLSKESNPLVSVLGMTWTPLLITIGLLTIYLIYAYLTIEYYQFPITIGWMCEIIYWISLLIPSYLYIKSMRWKTLKI